MRILQLLFATSITFTSASYAAPASNSCTENEINALQISTAQPYRLQCNLNKKVTINRPIEILHTSQLLMNCQGGGIKRNQNMAKGAYTLRILGKGSYDINIQNCYVHGNVRVQGKVGNINRQVEASRKATFVDDLRADAAHHITFNNVRIIGLKDIKGAPLYISPGVHNVTVKDSQIKGYSDSVGIYLDVSSHNNKFIHNYIATKRVPRNPSSGFIRELIAIDGSEYNTFDNNYFAALNDKGILLYRNCGEGGAIRHTAPRFNTFKNNLFFYRNYTGNNPAIYFGSRMYNNSNRHCADDNYDGLQVTPIPASNQDDKDFAQQNTFISNGFVKRNPSDLIRDSYPGKNLINNNQKLTGVPWETNSSYQLWKNYAYSP